jgi:molybdate/tungstate transport system substrate-binding protein
MSKGSRQSLVLALALVIPWGTGEASAQTQQANQLNVCHAGSVSGAFAQVEDQLKLEDPGITIWDFSGGSLDLARQLANGLRQCDVYAAADYVDINALLKPAGLAEYTIVFAQGRMVLTYLASNPNAKGIAGSGNFNPPKKIPDASPDWYRVLLTPGVKIGGVHPYLDPGSYRSHLIFQLAQLYYKVPNLYNDLLKHYTAFSLSDSKPGMSNEIASGSDFQFSYEHSAQAAASKNPDYRYLYLPDSVDLSNPAKNSYYSNSAIVVPGLGLPGTAPSVSIPATRVAWGITILSKAPNRDNAIKFLRLLLGNMGASALASNGPVPVTPAVVSASDYLKLPTSLKPLVKAANTFP